MNSHENARTTSFGRAVMVRRVLEEGWSVAAVARAFEVSTRTVRKWLARFRSEGHAGLQNRSSAPRLVANKLPAPWLAMITRLRRDYRMTGEEIAERLHLARSTVATRHAPLDRHRRGHLPDGVASDGAPNDGLRGAVRPDFRAGNELLGESGPRLRNRSGVPNLSRNN